MDNCYCTVFSKFRLYQGLALYYSLRLHATDFIFFVLCMDTETYELLTRLQLKQLIAVNLESVETEEVLAIKSQRTINEYCYTLKPVFLLYVLNNFPEITRVTYLDADIFFYSNPDVIFRNQENYSVLLSRHDYTFDDVKQDSEKYGIYNSGLCSFKGDKIGFSCLEWWRDKCIDWCFDRVEEDRFTDQKYLTKLSKIFDNVGDINTPGINISFWNHHRYKITRLHKSYYIDDKKLICYHFSLFRMIAKNKYVVKFPKFVHLFILHQPYGIVVQNIAREVKKIAPRFNGFFSDSSLKCRDQISVFRIIKIKDDFRKDLFLSS